MDAKQYKAIKQIMDNPELADEMEKENPGIKAMMAGYLCSPWLPVGIVRKLIMLMIALFAIIGAQVYKENSFYWLLILLPLFSPRIMAEIMRLWGKISK
jgi:hypothetical protein